MKKIGLQLFILVFTVLSCSKKQDTSLFQTVNIHIDGKKYEYLCLEGRLLYDSRTHYFEGKSKNGYDWVFEIPKTSLDSAKFFYFSTGKFNPQDTAFFSGIIISVNNHDTLFTNTLSINEKKNITYHLKYLKTDIGKEENAFLQDTIFIEKYNFVRDFFEIKDLDRNSEMALSLEYERYASSGGDDYEQKIEELKLIAKKHPDSQHLMYGLYCGKGEIHKTDIEAIYNCFSETNRQSVFGKFLYEYLHPVFENITLPLAANPDKSELLITDSTKYNLIELTAWWCGACRALLPALKELDMKYKDKLIITYVSIDDETTIDKFRDYIKEENIDRRCLWSGKDRDNFVFRLGKKGIPVGILISPKGDINYLRINRDADYQFLVDKLSNADIK